MCVRESIVVVSVCQRTLRLCRGATVVGCAASKNVQPQETPEIFAVATASISGAKLRINSEARKKNAV